MRLVVDVNRLKELILDNIKNNLFNWIDIRNNFNNLGINVLEELLKIDNIGFYTDSIHDAIKIRNINKNIPIIVTNIKNTEQVYDLIINNLILAISSASMLEEITQLDIKDKLLLAILIKTNDYDEGIREKACLKFKETKKDVFVINNLFAFNSNNSNNLLDSYLDLVEREKISSFIIGDSNPRVSDGFINGLVLKEAVSISSDVKRSFKLEKNQIFEGKKIKKDCYGIKIKAYDFDPTINQIIIDNEKWKIVNYFDNYLYLIGSNSIKSGKRIDLTSYYKNGYLTISQKNYIFNGKTIKYDNIN